METRPLLILSLCTLLAASCASSELDGDASNARSGADVGAPNSVSRLDGGDGSASDAGGSADVGEASDAGATFDASGADTGSEADMGSGMPDMGVPDPCQADPSASGWQALGGPLSALPGDSNARSPSIAIDASCRPVIAFHEDTATMAENIFVYRWNGNMWIALGSAIDATNQDTRWTTGVRVATHGDDVYIAWAEITTGNDVGVFVAKWNGTSWDILGAIPHSGRLLSFTMGFLIDEVGRPTVAWNEDQGINTPLEIEIWRYENDQWGRLGTRLRTATNNAGALAPSLVESAGVLHVAWQEDSRIHLRRWNGTTWEPWGNTPIDAVPDPSSAFDAQLAVAPDKEVVLGWREAGDSTDVYIERWDGMLWSIIADGLDVEPETQGRTNTNYLDVAIDSKDRTVFVFEESEIDFGGTTRVHVWRHDGAGLAALDGGILDVNTGDTSARTPTLAIDQKDRVVVAFEELNAMGVKDIHIWRQTD